MRHSNGMRGKGAAMVERKDLQALLTRGELSRREFIALGSLTGTALMGASLTGCNLLSRDKGSQVTISRDEEMLKVDPQDHTSLVGDDFFRHIYDKLVEWSPEGKIVPGLAESWEVSKDGLAWTFRLKKGVKFHNGESFTSQSVKVSIERLKDAKLAAANYWKELDKVETPDDYTAIIRTQPPMGVMLSNLAHIGGEMLPPKALADKGVELFKAPIGTGPYKFVEWVKNERFVMERWPDCWAPAKIGKIIYRPIMEESSRVAAVRTGEIDIAENVSADQAKLLAGESKLSIQRTLTWDQMYLGLKCDEPPFNKKLARQALNYAVDREAMVNKILQMGRVAHYQVPKGLLGFRDVPAPSVYDPQKAKAMLKESGYKGEKVKFIGPQAWYPKIKEIEEALLNQFTESGLNAELAIMEGTAFTAARRGGNYHIYVTGAGQTDPGFLLSLRVMGDLFKSGYKNEELFRLITAGNQEVDQEKRRQIYEQTQQIMYDEAAPMIWLYQSENINVVNKKIQGFTVTPLMRWSFRQAEIAKA
jgi:peptide/nickel transport system substrate-binding protein